MTVEDDDAGVALPEHGAVGAGSLAGAQEMRVQVETKSNNIPLKLLLVIEIVHFIVKFALLDQDFY